MLNNAAVRQQHFGDVTLEGYSRAAVQSYWRFLELKIGFDLGAQPWDFMGTPTWFISHTHLDHIAALPVFVARRRMMKMDPPTIYLPQHAVPAVESVLKAFQRLDRGRLPCDLVGVAAGDEIELSRELCVTVHATKHTVPSLGYCVWQRRKKLKPQYQGLSGPEIRDLRVAGTEVSEEQRVPWIAYLGDSSPQGLDDNPDFYRARILISEMTFLAKGHRREKIHKHGHMHLEDYLERADRFQNEHIVVGHFSTRYSAQQVAKMVKRAIPDLWQGRLNLWLD